MSQEVQDDPTDSRPPYERGWQRRDSIALLRYKVGLARAGGDLCGEFASMVKLALQDGRNISPPISFQELDITEEELDDIIREGVKRTARRIALLRAHLRKNVLEIEE